jgi:hypothetical protein
MPSPIEEHASRLLALMAESGRSHFDSRWLSRESGLEPGAVASAVDYLDDLGAVKAGRARGHPAGAWDVRIESRGRFLYQAIRAQEDGYGCADAIGRLLPDPPANPVATPYGLTADDWATVASRKTDSQTLHVVVALPFVSAHYDMKALVRNVRDHFRRAVQRYNEAHHDTMITVRFEHLLAGLRRDGFNRVARDILGADLAVFETSDWNPNVMLEMGVALTWGVPVLPLRRATARPIVLDVSGQGYLLYEDSAARILREGFDDHLVGTIEDAIRMKAGPVGLVGDSRGEVA